MQINHLPKSIYFAAWISVESIWHLLGSLVTSWGAWALHNLLGVRPWPPPRWVRNTEILRGLNWIWNRPLLRPPNNASSSCCSTTPPLCFCVKSSRLGCEVLLIAASTALAGEHQLYAFLHQSWKAQTKQNAAKNLKMRPAHRSVCPPRPIRLYTDFLTVYHNCIFPSSLQLWVFQFGREWRLAATDEYETESPKPC